MVSGCKAEMYRDSTAAPPADGDGWDLIRAEAGRIHRADEIPAAEMDQTIV